MAPERHTAKLLLAVQKGKAPSVTVYVHSCLDRVYRALPVGPGNAGRP